MAKRALGRREQSQRARAVSPRSPRMWVNGGASAGKARAKPEGKSGFTAKPSNAGEWRRERWEGASKARGREQQHREALGCGVNGGASAGKARAKPEGESSNTAKPSDVG